MVGSRFTPTQGELELLVMEGGEEGLRGVGREHVSLKGILKREKEGQRAQRKKRKRRAGADEVRLCLPHFLPHLPHATPLLQPPAEESFSIDVADPRFTALYSSHHFAPDPSHPQYRSKFTLLTKHLLVFKLSCLLCLRPTKAMAAIMDERQRWRRGKHGMKPDRDKEVLATSDPR